MPSILTRSNFCRLGMVTTNNSPDKKICEAHYTIEMKEKNIERIFAFFGERSKLISSSGHHR